MGGRRKVVGRWDLTDVAHVWLVHTVHHQSTEAAADGHLLALSHLGYNGLLELERNLG